MATKKNGEQQVMVTEIGIKTDTICIIGRSPMLQNCMSAKVRGGLLLPAPKKTAADKASKLKHEPIKEYRSSLHRPTNIGFQTAIGAPAAWVKNAICCAAIDMPGAVKSQLGRNVFIPGEYLPIWGVPKLHMAVVRCADISRTPDIRTRAILPEWACEFSVEYVTPLLKITAIANLIQAAGITQGLGDFRPQKGKGSYGQFQICAPDDPDFLRIVKAGGKETQLAAIDAPEMYDFDTEQLMDYFEEQTNIRGLSVPA